MLGPNASGKSTFFRTIAGLIRAQSGQIHLDGVNLAGLRRNERARKVAYMPQAFASNAVLTVFEAVLLALKQSTGWRVRVVNLDRVTQTLAGLGLLHLADRDLGQLCGGQAQMVAVAQVLVRDPRVVLLDEPTSALDLLHKLTILHAVRAEVQTSGRIALAALHDLNLAAEFCDRLILIREGRMVADGPPAEVLARPKIGQVYGVATALEHTRRGPVYVDAHLKEHA